MSLSVSENYPPAVAYFVMPFVFALVLLSDIASPAFGQDIWNNKAELFDFGDFTFRTDSWRDGNYAPVTINGNDDGNFRLWDPSEATDPWIWLGISQASGGWDATVARNSPTLNQVWETDHSKQVKYRAAINLDANVDGHWWSGAKIVISKTWFWDVLDYECYIIENSDLSPAELAANFGNDFIEASWAKPSWHGGRKYKHYTNTLDNGIKQVWSIRQGFPAKVLNHVETIPVGSIQEKWMDKGLVPWWYYPLGWLVFLETEGENNGSAHFDKLSLPTND